MHLPLVIHAPPNYRPGEDVFEVYCDSSHGNAPDGLSYGGFLMAHKGGGVIAWKCRAQAIASDSPGAQELLLASLACRWTLALRMLLTDLDLGVGPLGPTTLWTDSQILLDGTHCEKLSKSSRWLATRYAMIRFGIACGAIKPTKCPAEDNLSDILTKAITGARFEKLRAAVLGLAHARR